MTCEYCDGTKSLYTTQTELDGFDRYMDTRIVRGRYLGTSYQEDYKQMLGASCRIYYCPMCGASLERPIMSAEQSKTSETRGETMKLYVVMCEYEIPNWTRLSRPCGIFSTREKAIEYLDTLPCSDVWTDSDGNIRKTMTSHNSTTTWYLDEKELDKGDDWQWPSLNSAPMR